MTEPVSLIIPLAPGESEWQVLVESLKLPEGSEVILACGSTEPELHLKDLHCEFEVRPVAGGSGRAGQMNAGANSANNGWLWFLHADSRLAPDTLEALEASVASGSEKLYFFDLVFRNDGPIAMRLNEWAVKLRAGCLKIPFGDQGFLIRKDVFERIGQYREDLPYGEDHVFVWQARQQGIPVVRSGGSLLTSARKYKKGGWLKVTALHVWLTLKQALPEFAKLIAMKLRRVSK